MYEGQWEYQKGYLRWTDDNEDGFSSFTDNLNRMGYDEWELVSLIPVGSSAMGKAADLVGEDMHRCVWKRRIDGREAEKERVARQGRIGLWHYEAEKRR